VGAAERARVHGTRTERSILSLLGLALALPAMAGCTTARLYDLQRERADALEVERDELEAYVVDLEARNDALSAELAEAPTTGTAEAAAPVASDATPERDLEAERAAIQARIDALETADAEVAPVPVLGGYGFSIAAEVAFGSGATELSGEGRALVVDLAKQIAGTEFAAVWVRGHTDGVQPKRPETLERFPHGKLEISVARAVEVAAILVEAGLPADRVLVTGFGSARRIADDATEEGRRSNRRVEIFVLGDPVDADARGGL
jgi:flagellar motor protein MotB